MAKYDEKELLVNYVQSLKSHAELKAVATEAWGKVELAKMKIVEYLEDIGATSTAKYEGLGRLGINAPTLTAKFDEDDRDKVFKFLKEQGLEDVIKETIHHSTFSSLIANMIKQGDPLPEFITTKYRKNITFTKA